MALILRDLPCPLEGFGEATAPELAIAAPLALGALLVRPSNREHHQYAASHETKPLSMASLLKKPRLVNAFW
jgi:hypothetical protein